MYQVSAEDGQLERKKGRIRTVQQNEAAECGLASLAMIGSAYGRDWGLVELRRRFSMSARGTTLRSLMAMADALGFSARPVRLEMTDAHQLKVPAILHWGMNHFVVLDRVRRGKFLIHDPARGRRWIDRAEFSEQFTGVALELTPSTLEQPVARRDRVKLSDLARSTSGLLSSSVQLIILALVMQSFAILGPIINQLIIDEAISKGDLDLVTILVIAMATLLLATTLVKMVQGFVELYLGTQLSFQLQTNLLRHVLRLPVSWFEKRHIGDIISRFGSLSSVRETLSSAFATMIVSSIIVVTSTIMMVMYSPMLSAIQIAGALILLIVRAISFPYLRRKSEEGLHLSAKVDTTFLETLRGARSFKLFSREQDRLAVWQNEQAQAINNQIKIGRFSQVGGAANALFSGLQQVTTWGLGAGMVIRGEATLGMLFAFQAYASQFGSSSLSLVTEFFRMKVLGLHLERISDVALSSPEEGLDVPLNPSQVLVGALQLSNVSFRYGDHEPFVLKNVSFDVKPNEFVCLQGPSGQGKTTIMKLLLGFQDPESGEVLVDGVPLRRYGIRSYREQIGVVLQDDQLFSGTISDNISFFDIEASEERIREAASRAFLIEDIDRLPMGLSTLVGDLGSTLSAGQRQRLLLARALYRQPKIIFLDEGTANLDPAAEREVMRAINNLNITRVVIAHREGASFGADRYIHVANQSATESDQNRSEYRSRKIEPDIPQEQ